MPAEPLYANFSWSGNGAEQTAELAAEPNRPLFHFNVEQLREFVGMAADILDHLDECRLGKAHAPDEPFVAVGGDKIGNLVMDALRTMTPREISDRIRLQPCRTCGVPAGEQCRSQSGPRAASHVERLRIFTEAMRADAAAALNRNATPAQVRP